MDNESSAGGDMKLDISPSEFLELISTSKEITMAVTQAQLDQLKSTLGSKADAIISAIDSERQQVSEAITLWKAAMQDLQKRIEDLEAQHNLTLDFDNVLGKFDQGLASLPTIYEPPNEPPNGSPVTESPPMSEPVVA